MTNEDTVYMAGKKANESNNAAQQSVDNESGNTWKVVSLGGFTGVLLGAGASYAYAHRGEAADAESANQHYHTLDNGLMVAEVSDDLSFEEAFEMARHEIGNGGVFHWHGNTYSTYNAEEWNALSEEDKAEFAELVRPEISVQEIGNVITDDPTPDVAQAAPQPQQPQEVHVHNHYHQAPQQPQQQEEPSVQTAANETPIADDVQYTSNQNSSTSQQTTGDDDVQVIAQGKVDGHDAVALDITNDGDADVVVIDMNDNQQLDEPDVVVDRGGNMATMGELMAAAGEDSSQDYTSMDSSEDMIGADDDVAPSTPDYVDDADLVYV